MNPFSKDPLWKRAAEPVTDVNARQWLRGGLAATGAFLAVSVASAVTSAARRRGQEE